jgi:ribosomal protein L37AE/L43A
MIKVCKECNREFKTYIKTRIFCCRECTDKYKTGKPNMNKSVIKICPICKRKFIINQKNNQFLCSLDCAIKWRNLPENKNKRMGNVRKGMIKKYGKAYPIQIKEIKEKIDNTNIKLYDGHPWQNKEIRLKIKKTMNDKYNSDDYNSSIERLRNLYNKKFLELFGLNGKFVASVLPMFKMEEFNGIKAIHEYKCLKCGTIFSSHLKNGTLRCTKCESKGKNWSYAEHEVRDYIKSLLPNINLVEGSKKIIPKYYQLDMYLPNINLAIEYNGIFHHCELRGGKDKNYHIMKTNECTNKNINLIHIFSNEWDKNSKERTKQKIKSILIQEDIIYTITSSEIDTNIIKLEINNIDKININYNINNDIITITNYDSFSFDSNLFLVILDFLKVNFDLKTIIFYLNRNWNINKFLIDNNFESVKIIEPSCYYLNNNYNIFLNDIPFIYDDNLTEIENLKNNKCDRVWNCGKEIYKLTL